MRKLFKLTQVITERYLQKTFPKVDIEPVYTGLYICSKQQKMKT